MQKKASSLGLTALMLCVGCIASANSQSQPPGRGPLLGHDPFSRGGCWQAACRMSSSGQGSEAWSASCVASCNTPSTDSPPRIVLIVELTEALLGLELRVRGRFRWVRKQVLGPLRCSRVARSSVLERPSLPSALHQESDKGPRSAGVSFPERQFLLALVTLQPSHRKPLLVLKKPVP